MSSFQEVENFRTQQRWEDLDCCNEEERELEEALSLSDLPITTGVKPDEAKEEENEDEVENLEFDFDFGSLAGSMSALDGEMCVADEVFSGGQMLPYRNSVSSMSGLRSVSRSESIDRRGFGSRSSSSRSSSVRSHYSATSTSGSSTCSSNNTAISVKTVPFVSKSKVVQNQFHSYPSPKPQILGTASRFATHATPIGQKSKMWEVLKLGLVRTPEIELQDLKLRHHRTNDFGKKFTIPGNNSSSNHKSGNSNVDRARKSCSADGHRISDFVLEMQKRKNQSSEIKSGSDGGILKSCKCAFGVIEPMPTRSNNGVKSGYFGSNKFRNGQNITPAAANQDKNVVHRKHQLIDEQQQHKEQQQKRNSQIRQGKKVTSHHHHRTFEWLKNLSHASVLNDS